MTFLEFMLYFGFPLGTTAIIMTTAEFDRRARRRQWDQQVQAARDRNVNTSRPSA